MIEEKKTRLKVAYKGVPTEEEVRAMLRKKKANRIIRAIFFILVVIMAAWYANKIRLDRDSLSHPSAEQQIPE